MRQVWFEDDIILDKIKIPIEKLDTYLKSDTNRRTKNFIVVPDEYYNDE